MEIQSGHREASIAALVLLGLFNLCYRIGACMLYSFCGFHFIFLICFCRVLQKHRTVMNWTFLQRETGLSS